MSDTATGSLRWEVGADESVSNTGLRRLHGWHMRPKPSKQKVNIRIASVPVTVPEGRVPGDVIAVRFGARLVNTTIPPGAQPGTVFKIQALVLAQDSVLVIGSPVDGETRVQLDTVPPDPELIVGIPVHDLSTLQQILEPTAADMEPTAANMEPTAADMEPTAADMEPSAMPEVERESTEVMMEFNREMEFNKPARFVTSWIEHMLPRTSGAEESMAGRIESIAVHRRTESI